MWATDSLVLWGGLPELAVEKILRFPARVQLGGEVGSSGRTGVGWERHQITVKILEQHRVLRGRQGGSRLQDKGYRLLLQELRVKGHAPKEGMGLEVIQVAEALERVVAQELLEQKREPLAKRGRDLIGTMSHPRQHGHMIFLSLQGELSSCQGKKQDAQRPPVSHVVVGPATQDFWGYKQRSQSTN